MLDLSEFDGSKKAKEQDERNIHYEKIPAAEEGRSRVLKKLFNTFGLNDPKTVSTTIIDDYVIPGIKNMVLNAVQSFLYKDSVPGITDHNGHTSYDKAWNRNRNSSSNNEPVIRDFDYRELSWRTRGEAEKVRVQLLDIFDEYSLVKVSDLFEIADKTPVGNSTGNNYGWYNLDGIRVVRRWDGRFALDLPTAVSLR